MTDLREAIALTLCNFDSARLDVPTVETIDDFRSQIDRDVYIGMADAVIAILPDAEALAEVMVSVRRVLRGIAEHPRGDDVDRAAAGIALKLIDAALSKYWKGTGRAEA